MWSREMKSPRHLPGRQQGFTLVELMVAISIGLFLTGGLLTLTGAMKRTGAVQSSLDLLHDNERLATTIMTDVVQTAGFFPLTTLNVGTQTVAGALPAVGSWAQGQSVLGVDGGTALQPNDTLSIRYLTGGNDGVINCTGATSAVAATWINNFNLDGNGNLGCLMTVNGTVAPLSVPIVLAAPTTNLGGLKYMHFLYGVQSNTASGFTSVDTYLTATQVSSLSLWNNVYSVQAILYFSNPLFGQPGQTAATSQYIVIKRVIALMNKAGVT
jgi:type IV pilus assembly protein PilW